MKVRKSDKKTVRETPRAIPTSRRFKFYLKWIKCFSFIPWLGPNAGISSSKYTVYHGRILVKDVE
jgi:hypothetical protein